MKNYFIWVAISTVILSACSPVKNNVQSDWNGRLTYHDKLHASLTQVVVSENGNRVSIVNPTGIQTFNSQSGETISTHSSARNLPRASSQKSSSLLKIGSPAPKSVASNSPAEFQFQKIVYLEVPGSYSVLEFNYGTPLEEVSLIDLNTGKVLWKNNLLKWSVEQYGEMANFLAGVTMKNNASKAVVGAASAEMFPVRQIQEIVTILPQKNRFLIKTLDGLSCVDMATGAIIWNETDFRGEVAYVHYDDKSNTALVFGGNPIWMPDFLSRVQVNKKLFKIDVETGNVIWKTDYSRNLVVKNDGGFQNEFTSKPDVRLIDNKIILNFLQLEVVDFETGKSVFETATGRDAMMNVIPNTNPAFMFAFPVVSDGVVYRALINKVQAFNQSFGLEAYDLNSGELLWQLEDLTRRSINNLSVSGDLLLAGVDGADGVFVIEKNTGKLKSSLPLSKSGVTAKWMVDGDKLIVPEKSSLHVVDLKNVSIDKSINMSSATGAVNEMYLYNNEILVLGAKKGVAKVTVNNGQIKSPVKTGFESNLGVSNNKVSLYSFNPADAFIVLKNPDLSLAGSLKKSGKRTALGWNNGMNNIYEVKNDRIQKYSVIAN